MRAVAYMRVSTEDPVRDGVSLDAQQAKLAAFIASPPPLKCVRLAVPQVQTPLANGAPPHRLPRQRRARRPWPPGCRR